MKRLWPTILVAILTGAPIPNAWADVVELATGQRVTGTVKQMTSTSVVVERDGETLTFEREKVRAIYFEPAPAPTAAPRSPARDALEALKRVQSATKTPETFQAYGPRLREAQAAVDNSLQAPDRPDTAVQAALRSALQYHVLASAALKPRMTDAEFAAVGRDPALDQCPQFQEVLSGVQKLNPRAFESSDPARSRGLAVAMFGIGAVWACAADKIAEAERLLESRP